MQKKNNRGEIIFSSLPRDFSSSNYQPREFKLGNGTLVLFTDDLLLLKRAKILRKVEEICSPALEFIQEYFIQQIKAHSHTLKKLQGQLKQKSEALVENPMLAAQVDYSHQRNIVADKIKKNPEAAADVFIYLQKRIFEVEAHISSFEILHMGEELQLDVRPHNIRRLILNILHAFQDRFDEYHVRRTFKFEDDMAESKKIRLDYKIINTAFYNFFDNAVKYVKPYSEMVFCFDVDEGNYFKLRVKMKSLRIEKDEIQRLWELGYRGKNAKQIDGSGVGMYVIKKALRMNSFDMQIQPDYSVMEIYEDSQNISNEFVISGCL
ncbi:MAG: ATP-binding protein [Patescibacteria group bacterium]